MFKGRFGTWLALLAALVSPLLLECATTCQMKEDEGGNKSDVEGHCPVKLTSVQSHQSGEVYSECVTVRVWMKAEEVSKNPKIETVLSTSHSTSKETFWPTTKKRKSQRKLNNRMKPGVVRCSRHSTQSNATFTLWELVHDCFKADAGGVVSASYSTTTTSCTVSYTVPDPVPVFDLSVNQSSKTINVTVEPGDKVYARWCYRKNALDCGANHSPAVLIDPSQSGSALLSIPYLLPCVCVQVYYAREDSRRHHKCLFQDEGLTDVTDVWLSSEVTLLESSLKWSSECAVRELKISTSLCWKRQEHLCTPLLDSTLQEEEDEDGASLIYDTSAVDKHPHMCVQFSLQGSHHMSCPFQTDMSSWEVHIGPGRRSVFLYLTSFVPAKFSAQLCVLDKSGCTPIGQIHSETMKGNTTETRINVPLVSLDKKQCVQVWRSDPALRGRRILCPDYTHNRNGMYAVAVLIFVAFVASLGIFIHCLTKKGAAGWLCIQEPVLLVCSSEQSAHVSAVCALASILQGELSAKVHMALWSQSSQTKAGTGVADLGPLPWLYGQWEAVRKAQGKVLIVWSPEATETYEKWREERANMDKDGRKIDDYREKEVGQSLKLSGGRQCKKETDGGKKGVKFCDDKDWYTQREPSTVIAPVFTAALACLEGALQECKGQGVALVYLQGLCTRRDIPKSLRGVPRYCLPQDFKGFIQELGGTRIQAKTGKFRWHCWPRLLSKVLSIWLARKLALRLETLLPQGKKAQGPSVTSSPNVMSDKTRSRLKLPLAADMGKPGTEHEHEPLHESPWRAEKL